MKLLSSAIDILTGILAIGFSAWAMWNLFFYSSIPPNSVVLWIVVVLAANGAFDRAAKRLKQE